jgi:hypothetical protein
MAQPIRARGSVAMLVVTVIVITVSVVMGIAGTLAYRYYSEHRRSVPTSFRSRWPRRSGIWITRRSAS